MLVPGSRPAARPAGGPFPVRSKPRRFKLAYTERWPRRACWLGGARRAGLPMLSGDSERRRKRPSALARALA